MVQIAVITGPTIELSLPRVYLANRLTQGVELRLDLFREDGLNSVQMLKEVNRGRLLFTFRKQAQGGGFRGSRSLQEERIRTLFALEPDYFDLEFDTDPAFVAEMRTRHPEVKIISSYHDLRKTPKDLDELFKNMQHFSPDIYKICTTANSLSDSYKMLRFIQRKKREGISIIGLCMGEHGLITRKEGLRAGNYLNYTILHRRDRAARGLQFA